MLADFFNAALRILHIYSLYGSFVFYSWKWKMLSGVEVLLQ
jgi:hypothetical protein